MILKFNEFINESITFNDKSEFSENITEYKVDVINKKVIDSFQKEFPDKWILTYDSDDEHLIFVKDKPIPFEDEIPEYVYHVSKKKNLEDIGIKTSTYKESPFGYYDLSFFYLNEEDAEEGSIPYEKGKTYLYEIDTTATDNWTNAINEPIDGEENITTSDFIKPEFIKKIK